MAVSSKAHKIRVRNEATFEEAAEEISYDPATGRFWRKMKKTGRWRETGRPNKSGYGIVFVQEKAYKAHRVAWLLTTGSWPKVSIDHSDGNPRNNVFSNLREANLQQQACNRKTQTRSTSGYTGVHFLKKIKKWTAYVTQRDGDIKTRHYLGVFSSKAKAVAIRQRVAKFLQGEFARLE